MSALRAALVTPMSGPLARYGQAGAHALHVWAAHASLPEGLDGVDLAVVDASRSAAQAMARALRRVPQLVFGPYGAGPAVAAARATDRLIFNHGGASERLRRPDFPHVVNVLPPGRMYFVGTLRAVRAADPNMATVAMLAVDTGFGHEVSDGAAACAAELGMQMQTVAFAPGSAAKAARTVPDADVLLVAGNFSDELAAARALLARPWRAAGFVGAGVDEVLADLGDARNGLLGPCPWLPRGAPAPDEGPDAAWFAAAYRQRAGTEPPYPAAAAFAAGVLGARCLRDAGVRADDVELRAAALALDVQTLFGAFRIDPHSGLQVGHDVLTVQWQAGCRRVIVWPPERAEAALIHPLRGSP